MGRVRKDNQDAHAILPTERLVLVADGMARQPAGATAARLAVRVIPAAWAERWAHQSDRSNAAIAPALRDTVAEVSQQIHARAQREPALAGMGATVVLALLYGGRAYVAHMGDSRAYLWQRGRLRRLTEDHSVIALLLAEKEISPDEAASHPAKGMLSRFVGMKEFVYPDVRSARLTRGARLLLCTDGLTRMLSDEDLAEQLGRGLPLQETADTLVEAANEAGGRDNITVVVAEWLGRGHARGRGAASR